MKITQKARAELGRHQIASTGNYVVGSEGGLTVNCRCGWSAEFPYTRLPDGEFNAAPYLDGLMAEHQVEWMEEV